MPEQIHACTNTRRRSVHMYARHTRICTLTNVLAKDTQVHTYSRAHRFRHVRGQRYTDIHRHPGISVNTEMFKMCTHATYRYILTHTDLCIFTNMDSQIHRYAQVYKDSLRHTPRSIYTRVCVHSQKYLHLLPVPHVRPTLKKYISSISVPPSLSLSLCIPTPLPTTQGSLPS